MSAPLDFTAKSLPTPLVPAEVDLRDMPIPRETFARMAVAEYGVDYEMALSFANEAANRIEGRRSRQVRRAEQRARDAASRRHPQ